MAKTESFRQFLKRREASAWVSGDFEPLAGLLAQKGDASFFGPMGGTLEGAKAVAARYEKDAARFEKGKSRCSPRRRRVEADPPARGHAGEAATAAEMISPRF